MELAAYLQENAILLLSRGAFAAFSKQNGKYPTNARGGIGTLGIDWAITWIMSLRIYIQEKSPTFDKLSGSPNRRD